MAYASISMHLTINLVKKPAKKTELGPNSFMNHGLLYPTLAYDLHSSRFNLFILNQ